MIKTVKLEGEYRVVNCTKEANIRGGKVLNTEITVGEDLIISKKDKNRKIKIEYILQMNENKYKLKNSNFTSIIKKI